MTRLATIALLLVTAVTSHASFLVNGGFEQPWTSVWEQYANGQVPGWRTLSGQTLELGVGAVYHVTGGEGRAMMEVDGQSNVSVAQDVTLTSGQYELSFLAARRGVNLDGRNVDTCDYDVLWNGRVIASIRPTESSMQRLTYQVTGNQGVNTLVFRGMGTSDGTGALIDDARLEAVPEPCSVLAVVGAVASAIARRRKR